MAQSKVNATAREAVDRFLADNPELEELTARLSTFNVFDALKIQRTEIRHSNVLAWLLDPAESHGLGEVVLRRMLSGILLPAGGVVPGFSAARVELLEFSDVEVLREWRHIDVLVVDRRNRLVVLFENKIGSGVSDGQLARYLETVRREFVNYTILPVLLTLTGEETEETEADSYLCYSHAQVYSTLDTVYRQRHGQLSEAVKVFLQHYLETLQRLTMQDQELINLCKAIYRKHRKAIDTIIEYGIVSALQEAAEDALREAGEYQILSAKPQRVWFLPRTWVGVVPENARQWPFLSRPVSVCCRFAAKGDKIKIIFEVCAMDDPELRLACVQALADAGFKLTSAAFKLEAVYSRFYTSSAHVDDMMDYDEVRRTLEKLLAKAQPELLRAEEVLRRIFHRGC